MGRFRLLADSEKPLLFSVKTKSTSWASLKSIGTTAKPDSSTPGRRAGRPCGRERAWRAGRPAGCPRVLGSTGCSYAWCWEMNHPLSPGPSRDDLRQPLESLAERVNEEAQRSRLVAGRWSATHLALGLPTAVLAAAAGATALASAAGRVPAAILALTAAAFSAASTFLKGEIRAAETWSVIQRSRLSHFGGRVRHAW